MFGADGDREADLRCLKKYAAKRGLEVWAYCLMTNHGHWVVVPRREDLLGRALRDTHTVYAVHFNGRTGLDGHVRQGHFFSCPLDDGRSWAAVRYVERNPVRAELVERACEYAWSSASAHCGVRQDLLLSIEFPPTGVTADCSQWLSEGGDDDAAY